MRVDSNWRALLPLFAAVFIDIFSFGLMFPVIVALFHDPLIANAYPPHIRDIYLSLAFSLFPVGMFFGASMLGDLSDAFGRRRTLLVCMSGLAVGYALMGMAVEIRLLPLFLLGRLVSGLMAGTGPIAQAAVMDHTSEDERGRAMSNVLLVNCIGLVVGPMAGGVLGHLDFRLPLAFAFMLCILAFFWIRSANIVELPGHPFRLRWTRPIEIFVAALRHPRIGPLALAFLLFQTGFGLYYIYILVRLQRDYGFSTVAIGLFSMAMGVGFVIGTTLGYRTLSARLKGDVAVARVALIGCGLSVAFSALPLPAWLQWPVALATSAWNVPALIALLAMISASASREEQGWALGIGASMTALAFFLSGLVAAVLTTVPLWGILLAGGGIVLLATLPLRMVGIAGAAHPNAEGP